VSNSNTGGTAISGATNAIFAIPMDLTTAGSPYYFYCVVSATGATPVNSNAASVTVLSGTPEVIPPTYPSKPEVEDKTDINPGDLVEKDGKVYLNDELAEKIAKEVLSVDKVITNTTLPIFTVKVTPNGNVIGVVFTVKGKDLLAERASEINLIGLVSATTGDLLKYVSSKTGNDGEFTLIFGGAVFDGVINDDDEYEIWVYIKDGGKFDLDGKVDGEVIAAIFFAAEDDGEDGKRRKGGGCNAGYGFLVFALLPLFARRRD
jgi:Synergist-CTERM protein sorting domain-containing protein